MWKPEEKVPHLVAEWFHRTEGQHQVIRIMKMLRWHRKGRVGISDNEQNMFSFGFASHCLLLFPMGKGLEYLDFLRVARENQFYFYSQWFAGFLEGFDSCLKRSHWSRTQNTWQWYFYHINSYKALYIKRWCCLCRGIIISKGVLRR